MVSKNRRIALAKTIRAEKIKAINILTPPSRISDESAQRRARNDMKDNFRHIRYARFNLNPIVGKLSLKPLDKRNDPFPKLIKKISDQEKLKYERKKAAHQEALFQKQIQPFQNFTNYTPDRIESRQSYLDFMRH